MKKTIKNILRILGWIVLGIIFMLILVSILIQTRPVKNQLANIAENQSSRFLEGDLTIGKIDGTFFTGISIEDILLTYEGDTLLFVDELSAKYNLWPIITGKIEILEAGIKQPYIFLEQYPDSTWNVQKLIKVQSEEQDTSSNSASINLSVEHFEINNANFKINAIDSIIPKQVENLNLNLSLFLSDLLSEAHLKHFSFATHEPDFQLNELTLRVERDSNYLKLSDFYLKTAQNSVDAKVEYRSDPIQNGQANFETTEFQLNEFEYFIPDFKLTANPIVEFDGDLNNDSAYVQLNLKDNNQRIGVNLISPNLTDFIANSSEVKLAYDLSLFLENVEVDYWLGNPELDYLLNGDLQVIGAGTDPANAQLKLTGNLNETEVNGEKLQDIKMDVSLNNGNLEGKLSGKGKFGGFQINSKVDNILDFPEYTANIRTNNLDLALLTGIDSLYSNLNITADITGKGFDPKKLDAIANLEITDSRFQTVNFDTLLIGARYQNENITANRFRLVTDSVLLKIDGNYSLRSNSDIQAEISFDGLGEFQHFIPLNGLSTKGNISAHYTSVGDSIYLKTRGMLNETKLQDLKLEELNLDAELGINKKDTLLNAEMFVKNFSAGELKFDSVSAKIKGSPDSLFVVTDINSESLNTSLESGFTPGEKMTFTLFKWKINYKNQNWELESPPARIQMDSMNYLFDNFKLASDNTATPQTLSAQGKISRNGEEDFKLEIGNLDLSLLPPMFDLDFTTKGLLTVNLNIDGTADSALVSGDFFVNKLSYNGYRFTDFNGSLDYRQREAKLETTIAPKDSGMFNLKATLPVELRLDSMSYLMMSESPLNLALNISEFPMSILKPLNIEENIDGFAEGNIKISGTPESPLINGKIELKEAAFNEYKFAELWTEFNFKNNLFNLEAMIIPEDEGKLNVTAALPIQLNLDTMGYAILQEDSLNGQVIVENLSLSLLKAFEISEDINGFLDGKINLGGTWENPDPTGNIKLANGSAIINEYGINYGNMKLNLKFMKDNVVLDTLFIKSDDGNLTGTGKIDFKTALYKGDISQSEIQLDFNQFNLLNHRQFNIQVSGNASLGGNKENVVYGGDLKIPQAEIYLPAVMSMVGSVQTPEMPKPILVRYAEKMPVSLDSLGIKTFEVAKPDSVSFDYFDELQGQLRIRIPKNTWIKNEDLRIEISGEMELIKNKEFFELFGSVEVVRGQYDLLGRTFVIEEGTVSFQGGEDMLPSLNITANYTFRNARRAEQKLTVQISGTAESPEVDFLLDGSSISEGDALSYILFGKGMNELTMSEQENVEGAGGGTLAGKAAASVLSSQLTNFLSDKLNVDYIEVKSDGSFDNASVVVGKYITNDLFVSYEQRFGETDEQEIAKYEVKAEYELFRFLFFELNNSSTDSGFDIIIKFDVK